MKPIAKISSFLLSRKKESADNHIKVPTAFWTLRRILIVSDVIVLLSLGASVVWLSEQFRAFSVETFQKASTDTLKYLVAERLGYRYLGRMIPVSDEFARNPETILALQNRDREKLEILMQSLHRNLSEMNVIVKNISIYDTEYQFVAQRGNGETISLRNKIFDELSARPLTNQRKITPILWQNGEGLPNHSLWLPVGGFRMLGFIEIVTNPLPTLSDLGSVLGGKIEVLNPENKVLFSDGYFDNISDQEREIKVFDNVIVRFPSTDGNIWATISFTRDVTDFTEKTENLKAQVFYISMAIIGLSAFLAWLLVRKTVYRRINSFANAMVSISQGQTDVPIPPTGPDEMRVMAQSLVSLREAVQEVEANEKRLRGLLEDSPIGVAIFRANDGKILFANSQICWIYGVEEDKIAKRLTREFQIASPHNKELRKKFKADGYVENFEMKSHHPDGTPFWVLVTMHPLQVREGSVNIVWTYDISESKKIEQIKNEFVSTVSHELRTPLTSIRGSLGLITGGAVGDIPQSAKDLLAIASNNCDRLILLINDILDIEKIVSGKMDFHVEDYNLSEIITRAINDNRSYADKFQVQYHYEDHAPNKMVHVDQNRLIQVITNLLSNAAKFSPPESQVIIRTSLKKHNRILVEVIDQGPGIPDEFKSRIFGKFAQADSSDTRKKGGTGLGLNISKEIIEKLHGTIGFHSVLHQGSNFYFELPLAQHKKQKLFFKNKRILICEDDEHMAQIMYELLSHYGGEVVITETGTDCLQVLQKQHFDILTLDLNLPDQSGLELLDKIYQNAHNTPLKTIIISATHKPAASPSPYIHAWLQKPLDEQALIQTLKAVLRLKN